MTSKHAESAVDAAGRTRFLRSPIARKIVTTLVLWFIVFSLTGWLLDAFADREQWVVFWSFGASTFVAGVILVVQFLMEVEHRMSRVEQSQRSHSDRLELSQQEHAKLMQNQITSGISKINEATELFGQIEASAVRTDTVTQLVRNSTKIATPQRPDLVVRFAQGEIARLSQFLKDLGEGSEVTYEGEDRDWMLGLTRQCETSIDATSLTTVDAGGHGFVDGGLWSSDLGQRYLDLQREAVRRGVTIRRVFIMDRPELMSDPDFRKVCKWHQDRDIHIRVLDPTSARNAGTPRSALTDFIIFDQAVSYEAQPAAPYERDSTPVIINTRLILRQETVDERRRRFEELWRQAEDFR